jgi:hypothetical protein
VRTALRPADLEDDGDPEPPRSGGLYGTVLVLAVITALTKSGKAEASIQLGGVLVTSLVFWVVHIYADTLAARVRDPDRGWRELAIGFGRHELPILEAAIPPAIPLALGTVGILDREAASWAAIGFGLLALFGWGLLLGRALGQRGLRAVAVGLLNVAAGGLMVGLKVLVH